MTRKTPEEIADAIVLEAHTTKASQAVLSRLIAQAIHKDRAYVDPPKKRGSCRHCGGYGFVDNVVPSSLMNTKRCEVCAGTGHDIADESSRG